MDSASPRRAACALATTDQWTPPSPAACALGTPRHSCPSHSRPADPAPPRRLCPGHSGPVDPAMPCPATCALATADQWAPPRPAAPLVLCRAPVPWSQQTSGFRPALQPVPWITVQGQKNVFFRRGCFLFVFCRFCFLFFFMMVSALQVSRAVPRLTVYRAFHIRNWSQTKFDVEFPAAFDVLQSALQHEG